MLRGVSLVANAVTFSEHGNYSTVNRSKWRHCRDEGQKALIICCMCDLAFNPSLNLASVPGPGLDQNLNPLTPEAVADLLRSGAPMGEAGSSFLSLSTLLA